MSAVALLALALACLAAPTVHAAAPPSGTSSRAARDEALRSLPLSQLNSSDRAKVVAVLNDTTLYRHLPTQLVECDADLFRFLLDHPEVVIQMWRVLGITDIRLDRLDGSSYRADDRAGTRGTLRYMIRSPGVYVLYGEGRYEGSLMPRPVPGQCVFLIRIAQVADRDGKKLIQCQLDSFVRMENVTVEVLAKTFQPLVGHIADHNFRETAVFVARIQRAAENNPEGVLHLADQLEGVEPDVMRDFVRVTDNVALRAALAEKTSAETEADGKSTPRTAKAPTEAVKPRR